VRVKISINTGKKAIIFFIVLFSYETLQFHLERVARGRWGDTPHAPRAIGGSFAIIF
jgi:hypothetical protein